MKRFLLFLLLTATTLSSAKDLPDLGEYARSVLPPAKEQRIGDRLMQKIRSDQQYLQDAEVNDYLNSLGEKLVASSDKPGQSFTFFAVDDHRINAFALPGGYIGINTGLILTAQSESELAAVLSHEIAHVTQHHLARILASQQHNDIISMAAMALAILAAGSSSQASQAAISGAQAYSIQQQLDYTRTHEKEADRIGLQILKRAGFNPHAMPVFLQRMQQATRLLDGNIPDYLRTHPVTSSRISDIHNRVADLPYPLLADSLDFQLVQAKLKARRYHTDDAIRYFSNKLQKESGHPAVQYYGLACSYLYNHQFKQADQQLQRATRHLSETHPMIMVLKGQIWQHTQPGPAVDQFYQQALEKYPQYRRLIYDYSQLLLQNEQPEPVLKLINRHAGQQDLQLFRLQARAYNQLGNQYEQHRAQARIYEWQGQLKAAREQLLLARQASDSFYQKAIINSELEQLKQLLQQREEP